MQKEARNLFETSTQTYNSYSLLGHKYKSKKEHLDVMRRFIAINQNGGYIVKYKNESGNGWVYRILKESELKQNVLNSVVTIAESETTTSPDGTTTTKTKTAKYKAFDWIKEQNEKAKFAQYYTAKVFSKNDMVLSLYRLPPTDYEPELVKELIQFFESRVFNPRALHDELASHAYRFRDPEAFIEKCFVHYSETGNTGKSFLAAVLGSMYKTDAASFANVAIVPNQLENDQFNNWCFEKLMLHVEEAETSNYQKHNLDSTVKRVTTLNGSGRGMYRETEEKRHWAIFGMNTNKSDLYGMIRGDEALISRLVIIHFKPQDGLDWGGKDGTPKYSDKFLKNPNFAYSLKRYLETEYEIPAGFTPSRYYEPDKYEFITKALSQNKTTIDEWLELISNSDDNILRDGKFQKQDYKYLIKNDCHRHYEQNTRAGADKFKPQNFFKVLFDKGFEEKHTRIGGRNAVILRIETSKWQEMMRTGDNVDFEEMDDSEAEEADGGLAYLDVKLA